LLGERVDLCNYEVVREVVVYELDESPASASEREEGGAVDFWEHGLEEVWEG
jgi:hypothetical protein